MSGDVQHGDRHGPWGSDSSIVGVWITVGDDPRVPFINGFPSAPTGNSPDPSPLQFRLSVGPPNDCEWTWSDSGETPGSSWNGHPADGARPVATSIVEYLEHQIEIIGDVDGVVPGDVVFIIPMEYRRPFDTPYKGHDNFGNYVACRLLSTGEFYYGVP